MDNHNNNNILKGFTKQEIINYLEIKDRLIDVKNNKIIPENKLNYTDIMMYALPFILVLIAILVIYIVYKNRRNNDDNNSKCK
jgi:cytochrome c-type biogenesis protein CcmH/NrfF